MQPNDGDYSEPYADDWDDEYAYPRHDDYRSLSRFATGSVVLGVFSILTMFSWFLGIIPAAGIMLAILALRQIDRAPEEWTGRRLAFTGLALSLGLWVLGSGYFVFASFKEVPFGYTPITFKQLQPDPKVRGEIIPPDILDLKEDERIFIKGFIYPGRRSVGINQFILVPTIGHCKFCSRKLKSTEMVFVTLAGDLETDFVTTPVGVGGKLEVDRNEAIKPLGGLPYRLEADYIR